MSKLLRSFTKNERIAHLLIVLQKTSDSLRKPMSKFPTLIFASFARSPQGHIPWGVNLPAGIQYDSRLSISIFFNICTGLKESVTKLMRILLILIEDTFSMFKKI